MAEPGGRLPGAPDDEGDEPIVCHVDVDCFYAACERLREPALRGEPVVVGMGYEEGERHGAVATASYEAREYGVESAQGISQALDRLPRKADEPGNPDAGYYRPVDMEHYQSVAADVKAILHELADTVREVSVDEAYLDVTSRTAWEVAEGFARHVRSRIADEVGVTASVGVAPSMSAAKVASDHDKPDGLVVVEPGEVRAFLAGLPVEEIHGVGPVTAGELREMGVETAGDLAGADPAALEGRFGERGRELHRRARGEDDRPVEPRGRPKSLSRESAFTGATDDPEAKRRRVRTLAEAVAERAGRKGARYRTIGIKVVTPPYDVHTRERSLPGPVDRPDLVEEVALDLLGEFAGEEARKVGVRVSKLEFGEGEQAGLDGWADATGGADGAAAGATPSGAENADAGGASAADGGADGGAGASGGEASAAGGEASAADDAGSGPAPSGAGSDGGSRRSLPPGQSTLPDFLPAGPATNR